MTTKITIDAHAGWPVQVEITDQYPGQDTATVTVETVPAMTARDFYIHSSRSITVREMGKEA
jgi:hypothetical protein